MKKLLLILGLVLALMPARAADQQLYIIVTVTNAFGTTNIVNSITVNGSLRKHTNNVSSSPSTLIQSTNIQTVAATNMFRHFANYPPPGNGVTVTPYSTNAFQINALAGDALTYALAGDWGTITLKTNPVTGGTSLRVPMTTYNPTNQTNYASMLAAGLNLSTTALAQASILMGNFTDRTSSQSISNKDLFGGSASNLWLLSAKLRGPTNHIDLIQDPLSSPQSGAIRFYDIATNRYSQIMGAGDADVIPLFVWDTNAFTFVDVSGGWTYFGSAALLNVGSALKIFPVLNAVTIFPFIQVTNKWTTINWFSSATITNLTAISATVSGGMLTNVAGAFSGATITNLTALGGIASNMFSTRVTISNAVSINGTLGTVTNGIAISLLAQNLIATNSTFQGTNIWQGDVSYPWFNLTSLNAGNNQAVPLGTNRQVMLGGNAASATIIGFTGQRDGKPVKLYNNSSSPITLAQNTSDPVPENRIVGNVSGDVAFQPKEIFEVNWVPSDSRWHFTVPTASATNSVPTNAAPFTIATNDFAVNTYYTNAAQRAYVSATLILTATVTANAKVALYLDQDGDGTWEQTGIAAQTGLGLATADWFQLGAYLQPSARFMYTNLSTGAATASVNGGSSQWVKQ